MIRNKPIKTYQRKKGVQSSFIQSKPELWNLHDSSQKVSANEENNVLAPILNVTAIEDLSSGYFETTFDRIAKDVKLPTPLTPGSYSSVNISSDVPTVEPLPGRSKVCEFGPEEEFPVAKVNKRPKRKAVCSRPVYNHTEVIVKKRLKHDLINLSTKKSKTVKNVRKKVSAKPNKDNDIKTVKIKSNAKEKELHDQGSIVGNYEDSFVAQSIKNNKMTMKHTKQKNGYLLRKKKKNIEKFKGSSSNESNINITSDREVIKPKPILQKMLISNHNDTTENFKGLSYMSTLLSEPSELLELDALNRKKLKKDTVKQLQKTKTKENILAVIQCPADTHTSRNVSYRTRKIAVKNSFSSLYTKNFRRYSVSKSKENISSDFDEYDKLLVRQKNTNKVQSKLVQNNDSQTSTDLTGILKTSNAMTLFSSKICDYDIVKKQNLMIKPCSVVLSKCDKNNDPIASSKKSRVVSQCCDIQSSQDIFQSSISRTAANIEPWSHSEIQLELHEPVGKEQTQSIINQPNFDNNVALNVKPCLVKMTDFQIKRYAHRAQKSDTIHSLYHINCSTPINAYENIDRLINHLSPIPLSDDECQKNKRSLNKKDANEFYGNDNKYSNVPKINFCRSSRKKLSISYEEDKSVEMSNAYFERHQIETSPVKNIVNQANSSCKDDLKQTQSLTSEIQKSLEILKLGLENPNNKYNSDNEDKHGLLKEKMAIHLTDSNSSGTFSEKMNKHNHTSEFEVKSKDTCSQLTPVGIITTRSGRILKLNMSTRKKFFDNSNSYKIDTDISKTVDNPDLHSDYEVIDNSVEVKNWKQKTGKFPLLKSDLRKDSSDDAKRFDSSDISNEYKNDSINVPAVSNLLKDKSSNDPIFDGLTNVNASDNSENTSDTSSQCSIPNYERESTTNSNILAVDDEGNFISSSIAAGSQSKLITLSNKFFSQSTSLNAIENSYSLCINKKSEYPLPKNNSDNSDMERRTISNNRKDYHLASNIQEDVENELKNSISSMKNANISDSEWSTLSSSESNDYTTSDTDKNMNESFKATKSTTQLGNSSKKLLISGENQISEDHLSKESNEPSEPAHHPFPESTDIVLSERMKLLSTKINTRRRYKSLVKPNIEDVLQMTEKKSCIQSSEEHGSTKNEVHSFNYSESFEQSKQPLNVKLDRNLQPFVLLEKLKEPKRSSQVSQKKDKSLNLSAILESSSEILRKIESNFNKSLTSNDTKLDEASENFKKPNILVSSIKKSKTDNSSYQSNHSISKLNTSEPEVIRKLSLFLKPGKKWARSLSILNNIKNGLDSEQSSAGKGKNWRKSVQTILNMQPARVVQSCLKKHEDDKDTQPCFRALSYESIPDRISCLEEQSTSSASPSRFIRRMSIRVVPDSNRLSHIEDTSFLEAYGISASKIDEKAPLYNERCENVGIETVETEHLTAKDVVLQRCHQEDYISFTDCFPDEYLERCQKIGEGVYGEVFLYEDEKEKSVIKVIPIEGNILVNGERQKRFDEILSEMVIAKELHNLRHGEKYQTDGFVEVKNIRCIRGKYPEKLIELWKAYDDDKGSDNDCPSIFDENQLYIILELSHGGQDLEAFIFQSAIESHALFVQTALALAVAEQSLEFEHRDLHWGNILISHTKNSRVTYKLDNKELSYATKGMQVAIIDFTLSRMSYEGCCIFNDLALDPALFTAEGEYQFEIYRLMRDKIGNNWQKFEPYTNILWLHYTLDKMITALRYKRKSTKVHKQAISQLQELKEIILNYKSAHDFVTNCDKITSLQCKSTAARL